MTPHPSPRTWARYIRVSDERGREGERFHSPDQQDDEIRAHIAGLGGREGPRFYDASVSGGSMDRPAFNEAWAWAMARPHERGIACYDLSRFGRTEEVASWYGKLKAAGSDLVTAKDDISNTLIRAVYVGMAAHQREVIGERYASIIERRFKAGHHHGTPPVGYRREGKTGPLTVDPVLGPVVTEVFKRYARGDSVRSIAQFYAAGTGTRVAASRVRQVIALETYRGLVALNGQTRPGQHPALVDEDTWERCQARRRLSKATPSRTLQRVHVLAGLVYCGNCERRLVIRCIKGGRHLVCPAFYTRDPKTGERECETGVGAPSVERVESEVVRVMGMFALPDDSESSRGEELREEVARQRSLLAEAERRLAGVRDAVARLDVAYYSGEMPAARYERALRTNEERETREQFAVDTCREALSAAENRAAGVLDGDQRRLLQRVVEAWPDADPEHRRRIVDSWVTHVRVHRNPARVDVTLRGWNLLDGGPVEKVEGMAVKVTDWASGSRNLG